MTAKNDITGDALTTKPTTQSYIDGWERVFGKKKSSRLRKKKLNSSFALVTGAELAPKPTAGNVEVKTVIDSKSS